MRTSKSAGSFLRQSSSGKKTRVMRPKTAKKPKPVYKKVETKRRMDGKAPAFLRRPRSGR